MGRARQRYLVAGTLIPDSLINFRKKRAISLAKTISDKVKTVAVLAFRDRAYIKLPSVTITEAYSQEMTNGFDFPQSNAPNLAGIHHSTEITSQLQAHLGCCLADVDKGSVTALSVQNYGKLHSSCSLQF